MADLSTDVIREDFPLMTPRAWKAALFFYRYPEVRPSERGALNIFASDTHNFALSTISSGEDFGGFGAAELARIQQLSNAERSCVSLIAEQFWAGDRNKEPDFFKILSDISGRALSCVFSQDQVEGSSK